MSGGLVTADGTVLSVVQTPAHRDGPGTGADTILGVIADLVGRAGELHVNIEGVGIGLPGVADAEVGVMKRGVHLLPELTGIPLAERVQAKTGIPAFISFPVL